MSYAKRISSWVAIIVLGSIPSFGAVQLVPLLSFDETNGVFPHCTLLQGKDGDFYGTSSGAGGAFNEASVFKIGPQGKFSTRASFNGTNGDVLWDGLVLGDDGSFYGTAESGGINDCGVVFKMTANHKLHVMVFFNGTNGLSPVSLVKASDGDFYGITHSGGGALGFYGYGTIFKMSPAGDLTALFEFGGTNGTGPCSLIQGRDGILYGATINGGATDSGTVFQITTNGAFKTLWDFDNTNGMEPESVIQGSDGNLYGSTYFGGAYFNGVIFKLTTNGLFSTLHTFSQLDSIGKNAEGANPVGKLMEASDGFIYGGTQYGGINFQNRGFNDGIGTLFKISKSGEFTTLCSFGTYTNSYKTGATPNGLIQDRHGDFYGTTYFGGIYDLGHGGDGTVFKLKTVRPVIAILKPNQHASQADSAITVVGKTKAKVQTAITNVVYQLNGGDWTQAATTDNWTNWAAAVILAPDQNTVRAYAIDANGDTSRTNTLKLGRAH